MPANAGAFVAFCTSHFADCKSKIAEADVATKAAALFRTNPTPPCAIPKGVESEAATRSILAWMASDQRAGAMGTDAAIRVAMKSIWRCQTEIVTAGEPPAKTGDFVAYCPDHSVKCANEMVTAMVAVMVPDPPRHCSPPHDIKSQDMSTAVLGWLGRHPETYRLDTDDGIAVAFDHVWPCHRGHASR